MGVPLAYGVLLEPCMKTTIGFIGQGAMGSRMAARLVAAGHDLTVFDRLREATRPLEQRGATVATSAKQLAAGVDVVSSSVTDDTALEQVMLRSDGALAGARPGTTVIDMSTVSPRMSRRLHDAARAKGVAVLDAPVSGSTPQAEQGQLVIFIGGEEDVFRKWEPLLAVLGSKTLYMGPGGSGTTMKLCANTLLGLGVQALAEAFALGEKGGLSRERLGAGVGGTPVIYTDQRDKMGNEGKGEDPAAFPVSLMF